MMIERQKVFVTRNIVPTAILKLREHFDVEVWDDSNPPSKEMLIQKLQNIDGVMTEVSDVIDDEVLASCESLKIVANRAIGFDNIDLDSASKNGIFVSNTPGILQESCADFTMALMLSLARQVTRSNRKVLAGEWKFFDQIPYLGTDVFGKTLGLLGMGEIAAAVVKRAVGFDMEILYYSRSRKPKLEQAYNIHWASFDELLSKSDYISVHVPLTSDTKNLIGKKELKQMKKDAFLINTSRGGTVDHEALRKALVEGNIAGAALDVTTPEPITPDDPLVSMENVIITPHIASASAATIQRMGILAADNIIAGLRGKKMPSCLNPEIKSV